MNSLIMNKLVLFLGIIELACGHNYDGLRVKFGPTDAPAEDYFFEIYRIKSEAEAAGWKRTDRPSGPLPELSLYCPQGRAVCVLYSPSGFVAGLQLALPTDEYENLAINPEKNFVKWNATATSGEPARTYWTITQYYVSQESLKTGAAPTLENGATLQDGGVWVQGPDGALMRIPTTEAELTAAKFVRQNCIPNMGTHYYYGLSKNMKCEDTFPWFPLTNEGKLFGVGFMFPGKLTRSKPVDREWYELGTIEKGTNIQEIVKLVSPDAPSCKSEWIENYGVVSLHIYYTDEPWKIRCN